MSQSSIIHHHIYSPVSQLIRINGANRKHERKLQSRKINQSPAPRFSGGKLIISLLAVPCVYFHIMPYNLDAVAGMFY